MDWVVGQQKVDMVAAIVAGDGRVVRTLCWKNPSENGLVLELLSGLRRAGLSVEAVMDRPGRTATCGGTSCSSTGCRCTG
jgi:hypothetical protein